MFMRFLITSKTGSSSACADIIDNSPDRFWSSVYPASQHQLFSF